MNNKWGYTELKTELTLRSLIDKPASDLISSPSTLLDEKIMLALNVEKCLLFLWRFHYGDTLGLMPLWGKQVIERIWGNSISILKKNDERFNIWCSTLQSHCACLGLRKTGLHYLSYQCLARPQLIILPNKIETFATSTCIKYNGNTCLWAVFLFMVVSVCVSTCVYGLCAATLAGFYHW